MNFVKEDLSYLDIIWFAVDKFNKIIELTSGGISILPDFIINSVENVEFLEKYFFDEFKSFTSMENHRKFIK